MRSAILAAAFVATVLAVPYDHEKRAVVTNTQVDVVYKYNYVTVTGGQQAQASPDQQYNWWHYYNGNNNNHQAQTQTTAAPVTTATTPAGTRKRRHRTRVTTSVATSAATTARTTSRTTSPTTSRTTAPASTGAAPASGSYADIAVYHHNLHRTNHTAPAIAWDADLAKSAADIAATCVYAHNTSADGGGYGQNIAAGVEASNISAIITDMFYNGEVGWYAGLYGQAQPDMSNFEHWGHFSQVVWVGSTHVGCATQDCHSSGLANTGSHVAPYFTVCNYKNPGNYANQYGKNVLQPLGQPSANWNTGMS